MRTFVVGSVVVFLVLVVAGCGSGGGGGTFDNSGGPPPPGAPITSEAITVELDAFCTSQLASALRTLLIRTETDIPVIGGDVACTASLRTALASTLASLTADQALGIFTLGL